MGRQLWDNLGTLVLALFLALLVWIVAINQENPAEERILPEPVSIEFSPSDLLVVGSVITRTAVTVRAPMSVWETLVPNQVHVTASLEGLSPGAYEITLAAQVDDSAAQVIKLSPASIRVTLESRETRELPVRVETMGDPALGYELGTVGLSPTQATVTGPSSAVDRISEILATLLLTGLKNDFNNEVKLVLVDAAGQPVHEVEVNPTTVRVVAPITQKPGFRDVAVKVVIMGQVAAGYRVTNIRVTPPVITVSSTDPLKVSQLPGFVETEPLDISEASKDISMRLTVNLPEGVSPVGEQNVLVQVTIAGIESSLTEQRPLEIRGLGPGLVAAPSPDKVDVILSGPLPVLDQLKPEDVRVILDLEGLGPGTHQVTPQVILLPDELREENVLPSQIEVVISEIVTPSRGP